jgi:membrane-associated HD superfamily phosphohydrolase
MKNAGIVILLVGLLMTTYTGFTYFTREKVVDIGQLEITKENQHSVNWQPYVGIGIMIIGGVVLVLGVNRKDEKEIKNVLK